MVHSLIISRQAEVEPFSIRYCTLWIILIFVYPKEPGLLSHYLVKSCEIAPTGCHSHPSYLNVLKYQGIRRWCEDVFHDAWFSHQPTIFYHGDILARKIKHPCWHLNNTVLRRNRRNLSRLKTVEAAVEQQLEASVMSLKLQKRLAASLLGCGIFDMKVETLGDGMGGRFKWLLGEVWGKGCRM